MANGLLVENKRPYLMNGGANWVRMREMMCEGGDAWAGGDSISDKYLRQVSFGCLTGKIHSRENDGVLGGRMRKMINWIEASTAAGPWGPAGGGQVEQGGKGGTGG